MSGSLSSLGSLSGTGRWSRDLTFYQFSLFSKALGVMRPLKVTGEELPRFLLSFGEVVIESIHTYNCPITDGQSRVNWVCHHRFAVIQTSHGFFSVEKNQEGIAVQYSRSKADVTGQFLGVPRIKSVFHAVVGDGDS
ncbi:hypothetical protein TYRP_011873 [Tyrophagus putrescentiae]|nr:hypothetical protein TYRP_011873 [Tyrophagus putrescentiae]